MKKCIYLIMIAAMLLLITACAEQDSNDDLYGGNADNPGYSAGHYVLDNSSIFTGGTSGRVNASITNVDQTEYDRIKDNNTELQYDFEDYGNRNFNLLYRWKHSIVYSSDKTKMYDPVGVASDGTAATRVGRLPITGAYIPKPDELVRQNTIPVVTMSGVSFPHETHRHVLAGINFMGKDGKHFTPITNCMVCHSNFDFHNYESPSAIFMQNNLTKDEKTIIGASLDTNPAHEFCWNSCHTRIAEPTAAPKTTDCNTCHRIQSSGEISYPPLQAP